MKPTCFSNTNKHKSVFLNSGTPSDHLTLIYLPMKRIVLLFILIIATSLSATLRSQDVKRLSLNEVISLAEEQSPNALIAKHRFRASYWQYRTFVAEYRPSLTLSGSIPDYSTAYSRVWNSELGQWEYQASNVLQNLASLALTQNIGFTGGTISLNSDLTLENNLEDDK